MKREKMDCRKGEYFILWCRALAEFTLLSYRREHHGAGADCLFCPCGEIDLSEVGGSYQYLSAAIVIEGLEAGGHLRYKESQLKDEAFSLEVLLKQVMATLNFNLDKRVC